MENFIFCAVLVTLIDKEHLSFNVLTSILTETRSKPNQNYKMKHFMKILDSRKLLKRHSIDTQIRASTAL